MTRVPVPASLLAIDLSGSLLRVVDGLMGGAMRCGSGGTPAGALVGGKIMDVSGVSAGLQHLLARSEIRETRALIAISDTVATFRVLTVPASTTDQEVDAMTSRELPMDPARMATRWTEVRRDANQRMIYAAAWDRELVKKAADAARGAGLEAVTVELKSVCVSRAVSESSCVVVDMSSDPVEIILIDDHVPQLWHTFQLAVPAGEDLTAALVGPLRQVLRFYGRRRDSNFGPGAPILLAGEQVISSQAIANLTRLLDHPVAPLGLPTRIPPDVRHGTFLTCLGLLMGRN